MNSRTLTFELEVEEQQVEEAVCCIFHSVLFFRSTGKFHCTANMDYISGTLGFEEVDCDFIDLTYVRCSSPLLAHYVANDVSRFSDDLRAPGAGVGCTDLEFYQKKRSRWPFGPTSVPWEVWRVSVRLVNHRTELSRREWRETLGERLGEKVFAIAEVVNRFGYLPSPPIHADLDLVYDTRFGDVQPYLFRIRHSTSAEPTFGRRSTPLLGLLGW